jgi:hypothetical protein
MHVLRMNCFLIMTALWSAPLWGSPVERGEPAPGADGLVAVQTSTPHQHEYGTRSQLPETGTRLNEHQLLYSGVTTEPRFNPGHAEQSTTSRGKVYLTQPVYLTTLRLRM